MACKYFYKGHEFNSELELDDFLIEKRPFEPLLGDIVFSLTQELTNIAALIERIEKESSKVREEAKKIRRLAKEYDENGEPLIKKPPYIGVNRFVGEYRTPSGKRIIREFTDKTYWEERFIDWKNGHYTEDERMLFGVSEGTKISDPKLHDKMLKDMQEKWKNQAKAGDAIHNVLQLFFTKDADGEYLFKMSDEDFKLYCLDNLDADNKDFITEPVISRTIEYARLLHLKIKSEFGDNCIFNPEFTLVQKTNTINPDVLLGMVDLLIVDANGGIHILDYKTSIHPFEEYSSDKLLGYNYQLAIYNRMLEKYGFNMVGSKIMIAPILILGFHKDSNDKWVYDDIKSDRIYEHIENMEDKIWSNIDDFLIAPFKVSITTDLAISTTHKGMVLWFPDYSDGRLDNEKATLEWLKKRDLLKKNANNVFEFKRYSTNEPPITSDNETDFVKKVTEYFIKEAPKRTRKAQELRVKIKEAIEKGIEHVEFPTPIYKNENLTWLKDTISLYCNGNWTVDELALELLDNFGIIMLKTREDRDVPPLIDFIRVSTRDLTLNYRKYTNKKNPYKNRKSLVGALLSDILALSKLDNLMLEAGVGNVELMETMLVINLIKGLKGRTIGNILVVNPSFGNGLLASNEELLYCFNELNKLKTVVDNKFMSGEIKLATRWELVKQKVAHVLSTGALTKWEGDYSIFKNFTEATSVLDSAIQGPGEIESKVKALEQCLEMLTGKNLGNTRSLLLKLLDRVYKDQTNLKKAHIDLYNTIILAIGDLKGVKYRQLLLDHYLWFSDIMLTTSEGLTGNYSDNPGNLRSETLNLVTKLVTEAYLNTRDEIQRKNVKLRKLVEELKKLKSFGSIWENTVGNLADLYKKMYTKTADGDILFVNPNTLQGAERAFLEFVLVEINKDRFPQKSDLVILENIRKEDPEYYRVPLCVGGSDTTASTRGLLTMFKSKLEYFMPSKAWDLAKKKMEGIFNSEDSTRSNESELMYKMTNMFDLGNDPERRIEKIADLEARKIPLELNLETLLLKHMFAYSVLRNMDEVFPLIKSSMIHILALGALAGISVKNDTTYLEEYIKNKIFNQSIVSKENEGWVKKANMLKKAASMFTLAVAPVQMFYQPLLGLWNDISLMIRKPDGKDSFTFKHFMAAIKLVFGDLTHFSDKPTLCSALNELYGINDMDMNTYVDRISTAKKGIWNMSNFLFKFASRPDFYNRMTIFTALMMGDGCLDAHSLDSEGRLVYDWTQDNRFSEFAKNPKGNTKIINKLRSLYYTIAQLFVNEHARDKDGNLFELNMNKPNPLPRAYTNKQAESMKSLGDNIYGYYSHEKKSLIMSTAIGSLWLLFRTYWSGKKDLYLGHGGVKLQGDWEHYAENGEKYYYETNENGVVLYDLPPLSESLMREKGLPLVAPVMRWRGQWLEGIMLTLADFAKSSWNERSIIKGWQSKFGDDVDPYLKKVYKCNMQLLAYDLIMFAVIGSILGALLGDWLDNLKKENRKNRDFVTGLGVAAANVAVMSVKNSFLDFNFFSSIGSPFGLWTPFSIEWGARIFKNWWRVATGDEDFWDGVVNTSGGLKQMKPALDAIKPDMFRTEREGGTFNKEDL